VREEREVMENTRRKPWPVFIYSSLIATITFVSNVCFIEEKCAY
jgi:hypothetical protein